MKQKAAPEYQLPMAVIQLPKEVREIFYDLVLLGYDPAKVAKLLIPKSTGRPRKIAPRSIPKPRGRPRKSTPEDGKLLLQTVEARKKEIGAAFKAKYGRKITDKDTLIRMLELYERDNKKRRGWAKANLKKFQNLLSTARKESK